MTDITLSPAIETAKPSTRFPKLPRLGLGKALGTVLKCYGDALSLAYVDPFKLSRHQEDELI